MDYPKQIAKQTDNQIVFPILNTESIGDSLSSINYNFNALDVYTCNFEYSANNVWNNIFNEFAANSSNWTNAINEFKANSGCWNQTYTTVSNLSSAWLKPISLIYPFPFESSTNIISEVSNWINETLPVFSGTCYNFIVGQELYIFTPLYQYINQILSQTKTTGEKSVRLRLGFTCIGKGKKFIRKTVTIDCGSQTLDIQIPDKSVGEFVGLKFVVDDTVSRWVYSSSLYN
jgi:hypothetical protein